MFKVRSNTQEFIKNAKKVHGDKYIYGKVEYVNNQTKIEIICPIHGSFLQRPNKHLQGDNCMQCSSKNRITTQEFIQRAIEIHGNKYDYSEVIYINNKTKIKITCNRNNHTFMQIPRSHLKGYNCPDCSSSKKLTTEKFIKKANLKHNYRYDYSLVDYKSTYEKVFIICKEHGKFEQQPSNHLSGSDCPKCKGRNCDTKFFIEKSIKVHGDKYDYSLVNYTSAINKIIVKCKEHGKFEQIARDHLNGHGCSKCNDSKGEKYIRLFLLKNNISFISQYKYDDCRNINKLPFDFYLPDYNVLIEYDGEQHFKSIEKFGGIEYYIKVINNDKIKNEYCLNNDIRLLRISYYEYKKIDNILNDYILFDNNI